MKEIKEHIMLVQKKRNNWKIVMKLKTILKTAKISNIPKISKCNW